MVGSVPGAMADGWLRQSVCGLGSEYSQTIYRHSAGSLLNHGKVTNSQSHPIAFFCRIVLAIHYQDFGHLCERAMTVRVEKLLGESFTVVAVGKAAIFADFQDALGRIM